MQVREALINTAHRDIVDSRIGSLPYPNNYYGWGHVNALDAILYWGLVFSNHPTITSNDSVYIVSTKIKSAFPLTMDSLFLFYKQKSADIFQRVPLHSTGTADEYAASVKKTELDSTSVGYFSARDNSGKTCTNPSDIPNQTFGIKITSTVVTDDPRIMNSIPVKYSLISFPNPFNPSTTILVTVPLREELELAIFNILGQHVKTLFHGVVDPGTRQYQWNGTNERGGPVAGGMYIARLKTTTNLLSVKLILLK